jgi:Periplasmic binding protein
MDRSTPLRRFGVAVTAMAMLVAACGSGSRGASPAGSGGGGGQPSAAAAAGPTNFGTLPSPCGGGDAKGATDQGVTDTAINIAYGDDRGYAGSPGLSHEIGDAMKAMIKWCNNQGGINGRKITGQFYDAKITEANNVMTQACKSAFMLVGQGWALDAAAEKTRVGCNLVSTEAYAVSPEFASGPMQFEPVPAPADVTTGAEFAQLAKLFPDKVKKAAMYTTTIATENYATRRGVEGSKPFGWNWLPCSQTINYTGEPDYKPFLQKMKDCGVQIVWFTVPPGPLLYNTLRAANQIGFKPIWLTEHPSYTQEFADFNTNHLADNVYIRSHITPFEEANISPATQKYLDIVKGNGGDTSVLGLQSTSIFLAWATAAKRCGSTLTRQCMVNELSKIHDWTGGGLQAASDIGGNLPPKCWMLMRLQGNHFTRAYPTKPGSFDCSPSYEVPLPASFRTVQLNSDRLTTNYLTDKVIKPQP